MPIARLSPLSVVTQLLCHQHHHQKHKVSVNFTVNELNTKIQKRFEKLHVADGMAENLLQEGTLTCAFLDVYLRTLLLIT